MAVGKNWSVVH